MSASELPRRAANVLMVSTSYPATQNDWPGLFIRRVAEALARRDDVQLRLWSPPGDFPDKVGYAATSGERNWLEGLMKTGGIAHLLRTQRMRGALAGFRLLRMLRALYRRESNVDLYHVNWLQNALGLGRDRKPLLVTVLGTDMQLLKLPGVAWWLRRVFRRRRVAICPNARWMMPELQARFSAVATACFVPFGIEPRWFEIVRAPILPSRWLCVSRLTRGKLGTLFDWCEPFFKNTDRELHLFGPMQEKIQIPAWVRYHGPARSDLLSADWFPRATGLITLSGHSEGWPQVMLEAMAGGLPVVASRIAAHEDMLTHRVTGWLCDSSKDVGEALDALDDAATNREVGARARAWARATVGTWDDCAARYISVYRSLMDMPS